MSREAHVQGPVDLLSHVVFVKLEQRFHVLLIEGETKHVGVLDNAVFRDRLGDLQRVE